MLTHAQSWQVFFLKMFFDVFFGNKTVFFGKTRFFHHQGLGRFFKLNFRFFDD